MAERQSPGKLPRPASSGRRWTSFVAEHAPPGKVVLGRGSGTSPERQRPQRLWRPLRSLTEGFEARRVAGRHRPSVSRR